MKGAYSYVLSQCSWYPANVLDLFMNHVWLDWASRAAQVTGPKSQRSLRSLSFPFYTSFLPQCP